MRRCALPRSAPREVELAVEQAQRRAPLELAVEQVQRRETLRQHGAGIFAEIGAARHLLRSERLFALLRLLRPPPERPLS